MNKPRGVKVGLFLTIRNAAKKGICACVSVSVQMRDRLHTYVCLSLCGTRTVHKRHPLLTAHQLRAGNTSASSFTERVKFYSTVPFFFFCLL